MASISRPGGGGSGVQIEASSTPVQLGTVGATGSGSKASAWDHVHPRAFWTPADHGLITWSADPATMASNTVPTSGLLQVVRVHVPVATTVTNILLYVNTGGSGLTSGQSFAALYNAAGTRLGLTADQSSAWATIGLKTMALTTPQVVAAGDYFVAFYSVGTTPPAFLRGVANTTANVGLSAANSRFATADAGLTTSPPATMGAKTALSVAYWVALS